jgi:hypothetical protein
MSTTEEQAKPMTMTVPAHLEKTVIGTVFLVSMIFLAAVLAILGVIYNDGWAKGGVGAAVIIAILLYWSITKERKTLTP